MFLPGWDNISRVNDMLTADPVFRSSETLLLQPECLADYTLHDIHHLPQFIPSPIPVPFPFHCPSPAPPQTATSSSHYTP